MSMAPKRRQTCHSRYCLRLAVSLPSPWTIGHLCKQKCSFADSIIKAPWTFLDLPFTATIFLIPLCTGEREKKETAITPCMLDLLISSLDYWGPHKLSTNGYEKQSLLQGQPGHWLLMNGPLNQGNGPRVDCSGIGLQTDPLALKKGRFAERRRGFPPSGSNGFLAWLALVICGDYKAPPSPLLKYNCDI